MNERAISRAWRSFLLVALSGEGARLVEPSTLFIYRDTAERRFELRVRLDGGEERDVTRVERKTLEAERLNGEEV